MAQNTNGTDINADKAIGVILGIVCSAIVVGLIMFATGISKTHSTILEYEDSNEYVQFESVYRSETEKVDVTKTLTDKAVKLGFNDITKVEYFTIRNWKFVRVKARVNAAVNGSTK